jgi:transcription antitermination factor NusG
VAWFILYSAPLAERLAADFLKRFDLEPYVPIRLEERRNKRSRVIKRIEVPLFSRYLFLHEQPGLDWRLVHLAPGIIAALFSNGMPASVNDTVIEDLRTAQGHGQFDSLLADGRQLERGQKVKITEGAFVGHLALVASVLPGKSARVLLRVFGATRNVGVNLDAIRLVA